MTETIDQARPAPWIGEIPGVMRPVKLESRVADGVPGYVSAHALVQDPYPGQEIRLGLYTPSGDVRAVGVWVVRRVSFDDDSGEITASADWVGEEALVHG